MTHALATATRELSSPEMCDVLAGFRPYQRHQILESLQDEGKLAIRLTCITRPVQFLAYYRLGSRSLSIATTIEPEGGAS